jgi:GntR family transcriptional regulator
VNGVILSVDPDLKTPPFQQIVDQLRAFVERGELRPGDALPTVRQLATDLGVAPNTVARAYADLQDGGWLTSDGRRGTRIAPSTPADDRHARAMAMQAEVQGLVERLLQRGYSKNDVRAALRKAATHG